MAAIVNYFEVGSADPDAARSFYGSLFDRTFVKAAIAQAESLGASVAVPFVDNGAIEFDQEKPRLADGSENADGGPTSVVTVWKRRTAATSQKSAKPPACGHDLMSLGR
ncbi:hypothetical protein [Arthrobacter sp. fls2-241-R2A-200]|uniref:VOC family protein n=1 Tax=Arthrobacter sp. fls2-241-R2A-200 TaxID=3040281 RepID=UPI00254BC769|nr:hypothetical protein [Arthrobacter sp. fls2-241-R2A-200]